LALVPGIVAFAGGLPVMTDDKLHIGAIGVSGGTADQDEEIPFVRGDLVSRDPFKHLANLFWSETFDNAEPAA
jgi:Haem-degrading